MKRLLTFAFLTASTLVGWAQKDVSYLIQDNDFDTQGRTAWKTNGFGRQTNKDFSLKHGEAYREVWSGGTAMDAYLYQDIAGVPVGTYTLTVTAQNIKQDNDTLKCTGTWIYANDQKTDFNKPGDYSVKCVVKDGNLRVGAEIKNTNGNYVCVDYFRLSYEVVFEDIESYLKDLLYEATELDESNDSPEHTELVVAREAYRKLVEDRSSEGLDDALSRLRTAMTNYRFSLATPSKPMNLTERIVNPGFEAGGEGWKFDNMGTQGNNDFQGKKGTTYAEKWCDRGRGVDNCSLLQTLNDLPSGRYSLTASAQNIQQDSPATRQRGVYLVAGDAKTEVSVLGTYEVEAVCVDGRLTIGLKCQSATGNYVCVDDFQLHYLGADAEAEEAAFATLIAEGEKALALQTNTADQEALQAAIQAARQAGAAERAQAYAALETAISNAKVSNTYYVALAKVLEMGNNALAKGLPNAQDRVEVALASVQAMVESGQVDADGVKAAETLMDNAIFAYRVLNGSGKEPKVTTYPTVIVGCNAMVGRLDASGSGITETGFCWAEHPNPTVLDEHSSYSQSNDETNYKPVYVMYGIKASTEYWVRAYAITNTYAVGYGEPVRVITLPQGETVYKFLWNGDDDHNEWLDNAMREATAYYNTWTAIKGFRPTANYSPGTETADCSYGGWINVGPWRCNTGTMVHEMMHGTGVGQHGRWWDQNLKHDIWWQGERANRVTHFFELDPARGNYNCNGDGMHVCYQGNGSDMQQIRSALLMQALYEDGLPAVSDGACPFYAFESIDSLHYYITNHAHGQAEKFLCETAAGKLSYAAVGNAETLLNDSTFAWRVLYDRMTGLYRIQNLKSGRYFCFNGSGVSLRKTDKPGNDDQVQLMPARFNIDVKVETATLEAKPYWFARANRECDPKVMAIASASTRSVSTPVLDFSDNADTQFWLILTQQQIAEVNRAKSLLNQRRLERLVKGSRQLVQEAHAEVEEGADAAFTATVEEIDAQREDYTTDEQVAAAVDALYKNVTDFLDRIAPESRMDVTFLLDDAGLEDGCSWQGLPVLQNGMVNVNADDVFACTQEIPVKMSKGTYGILVRGFQRPGNASVAMSDFNKGNNKAEAEITVNAKTFPLKHIGEGGQDEKLALGGRETKAGGKYVPNDTVAARIYMEQGFYDNWIPFKATSKAKMTLGFRNATSIANDWIVIGDVSLYYFGVGVSTDDVVSIDELEDDKGQEETVIYGLDGIRRATLGKGINIVNGRKVIR